MENLMLALTLLIAGFVVVFLVLVLLIFIITLYGKLIQKAQKSSLNRKERKRQQMIQQTRQNQSPEPVHPAVSTEAADTAEDEIPGEIIAVIAAAVDALYGSRPHRIQSVKRSGRTRSAWGNAGIVQNTGTF